MICMSSQHACAEVRRSGLECLSRCVSGYYPLMEEYLAPALWPIALQAIASQQVGMQPFLLSTHGGISGSGSLAHCSSSHSLTTGRQSAFFYI